MKDKKFKEYVKKADMTMKEKAEFTIACVGIKGLSEINLWKVYGLITTGEKDKTYNALLRYLDIQMTLRKIDHDFTKDYIL